MPTLSVENLGFYNSLGEALSTLHKTRDLIGRETNTFPLDIATKIRLANQQAMSMVEEVMRLAREVPAYLPD